MEEGKKEDERNRLFAVKNEKALQENYIKKNHIDN